MQSNDGVIGIIDSATIEGAAAALSFAAPQRSFPWSWQNLLEVTAALIGAQHFSLAPPLSGLRSVVDRQSLLLEHLAPVVRAPQPSLATRNTAQKRARAWVRRNPQRLRDLRDSLWTKNEPFSDWIDWSVKEALISHAQRFGGLFDPALFKELGAVMELDVREIKDLHRMSSDEAVLMRVRRDYAQQKDSVLLLQAYMLSAVIRGRFHMHVAEIEGQQLLHHQVRDGCLTEAPYSDLRVYCPSNTESFIAQLLCVASYRERNESARQAAWAQAVLKTKDWASTSQRGDLRQKDNPQVALDEAIRIVKSLGIPFRSKMVDEAATVAFTLGVGTLTSVVLGGWEALAAGALAAGGDLRFGITARIPQFLDNQRRLAALAQAHPGSIRRTWSGGLSIR